MLETLYIHNVQVWTPRGFSKYILPLVNGVEKFNLNWISKTQYIIKFFPLLQCIWSRKNVYKGKKQS